MARRALPLLLTAATVAALLALAVAGHAPNLLIAIPAAVVTLPLLLGRYLGEGTLRRLVARFAPRARRAVASLRIPSRVVARPHGGRLIALGLARRGPPPLLLPR
jgi:hypothetical protein